MTDDGLVWLGEFGSRFESGVAVSKLESAGIPAQGRRESAVGEVPHDLSPHSVWVRAGDEAQARQLLDLPEAAEQEPTGVGGFVYRLLGGGRQTTR